MIGYGIAITEILFYFIISKLIRKQCKALQDINAISYYWFTMTILTFIWECSYITDYDNITNIGHTLIDKNQSVWTNQYDLSYILPWKLARIFYAEYGARADREYLILDGNWSKIVESSHAIWCGLGSLCTLVFKMTKNNNCFNLCVGISMGSQFMNSLLYMVNYWYQCYDEDNVNYITNSFPIGNWFGKRPFMYINIFWLIFPLYTLSYYLICYSNRFTTKYLNNKQNDKDIKTSIDKYNNINKLKEDGCFLLKT